MHSNSYIHAPAVSQDILATYVLFITCYVKFIHPLKQCFAVCENKVLQLMSAGASLKSLGKQTLFSQTEDLPHTVLKVNGLLCGYES